MLYSVLFLAFDATNVLVAVPPWIFLPLTCCTDFIKIKVKYLYIELLEKKKNALQSNENRD